MRNGKKGSETHEGTRALKPLCTCLPACRPRSVQSEVLEYPHEEILEVN